MRREELRTWQDLMIQNDLRFLGHERTEDRFNSHHSNVTS